MFKPKRCYGPLCGSPGRSARELGVEFALDEDDQWVRVDPSDLIFVCVCTPVMGYSWSLYFCHSMCADVSVTALERSGVDRDRAYGQLVEDNSAETNCHHSRQ